MPSTATRLLLNVLGGLGSSGSRSKSVFTQSLGAELLSNPNFTSWSGNNPTSWLVVGESGSDPAVSEVDPSGSAGNGAAQFISSATAFTPDIRQTILTIGSFYENVVVVSAHTSGSADIRDTTSGGTGQFISSAGTLYTLIRAKSTILALGTRSAPSNWVADSTSCKEITRNVPVIASADGTFTFAFALPATPYAGLEVHMPYRIAAPGEDFLNSWDPYLRRNSANSAWDFRLDSIVSGTRTNRTNVAGVGTPNQLRAVASGNNHDAYTGVDGTFTQRGSTVTSATHNTATGLNAIYHSPFTPILLTW